MQLSAVSRRCSTGSMTVLGDITQGTTPWATTDWETELGHLGQPDALVEVLDRGYRVPGAVLEFATRLLPRIAPDLSPPQSVREEPGELVRVAVTDREAAVAEAVERATALLERPGSVGLIAADAAVEAVTEVLAGSGTTYALLGDGSLADARLTVVPATLAKGLEFDWVVVLEPAELVAAEPRGLRRLYVVLTRAVSGLTVVHARPLPPELLAG